MIGQNVGPYTILGRLGEGGMGEVYRARDAKLNRDVAIKVLLPSVANDPDRMARFSREAQVLASLNHPNIAAIYGLEGTPADGPAKAGHHIAAEAGRHIGTHVASGFSRTIIGTNVASGFSRTIALVMELIEGEDLAQRIARGAIPLDEALPIARQIADALEAAHEHGIIHRDLKPANIKVRPDGTVKVLDFGLAKAVEPAAGSSPNVTQSPTITTPAMTQAGMILGTAAYMSPEQARGKGVDKRADIWAFGAVLFEMLTGQRAFAADDLSMTLAAVMLKDPLWAALPPATSPGVQQLLRRCLVKDPRQRIRDMGDVRLALESVSDPVPAPDNRQRRALVWAAPIFEALNGSMGRLLVVDQAAGIRAAPFDAAHPARTSADTSVLANVYYDVESETRGWLAVSTTGAAVYAPGDPAKVSLVWVDREGKVEALGQGQDVYRESSLSPDGTKAVVRQRHDLWIHDLQRGTRSRLTSGNDSNYVPLWSRDGTRIMFASNRGGDWDIYTQPADGSRPAEALLKRPFDQFPDSILADGTLLYRELHPATGRDLLTLAPDGKVTPLRVTPPNESAGQFSPGGAGSQAWLAYASDESGRSEIYVQSYPGGTNRIPVSTGGGFLPTWSRDGKELFYVTGDAVVAVTMRPDGSFGAPRRLFDRANYFLHSYYSSYDVSPDGKRFLMIQRGAGSVPRQLNVILNWTTGLKE